MRHIFIVALYVAAALVVLMGPHQVDGAALIADSAEQMEVKKNEGAGMFQIYVPYAQCNQTWGSHAMGNNHTGRSICEGGDLLTCASMVLATIGVKDGSYPLSPSTFNQWLAESNRYICSNTDNNDGKNQQCDTFDLTAPTARFPSMRLLGNGPSPKPSYKQIVDELFAGATAYFAKLRHPTDRYVLLTYPLGADKFFFNDPTASLPSTCYYSDIVEVVRYSIPAPQS